MARMKRVTFKTKYGRVSFLAKTPDDRKKKVTAFTFPELKKMM